MAYKDPEKYREWVSRNADRLRDYKRKWQHENAESHNASSREWQKRNPEYMRNYMRSRSSTDLNFRLARNLRRRLNCAIRRNQKAGSAVSDLGCSIEALKSWLMYQFQPGMTWGNYGSEWHIDHVRPLSSFDLTNHEQFLEACNWFNLQPLWATENNKKRAKW